MFYPSQQTLETHGMKRRNSGAGGHQITTSGLCLTAPNSLFSPGLVPLGLCDPPARHGPPCEPVTASWEGSRPGRCPSSSSFITRPESPELIRARLPPSCARLLLLLFADPRGKARPRGTRCAPALLVHPRSPQEARGVSPSAIPKPQPSIPRGRSSSRSPARSRLIASCLFFFAFEVRIPPTLPTARFCPAWLGGEPAVTQTPGHGRVAKPRQQDPAGSSIRGDSGRGDSASASPGGGAGSGGILHSQHLLQGYLIPPEPGTARGAAGAAGTDAGSGRCGDRQSHQQLLTLALSLHPEELKPLERRSHCSSCA